MTTRVNTNLIVHAEQRTIMMTRVFHAPRELVFRVCTDPALVPLWWGPRRLTTSVDEMDVRPGGRWRYVQRDAQGNEFAFHGVYREIEAPERVVTTWEFEGMPGHELLETITFEERDGQTVMTVTDTFQSLEDLQGMLESGMEQGANESYERLGELLAQRDLPAGLAQPALRALAGAGIVSLAQLPRFREAELKKLHGMGPKALELLRQALAERGLAFASTQPERPA